MKPGETQLYAGLMSGTSLDGVDAVLVDFARPLHSQKIRQHHLPYSRGFRESLVALCASADDEIARLQEAARELSECYADTLNALLEREGIGAAQVAAAGCHGQTVRHNPDRKWTVQLLNPHVVAERTKIDVAHDFRGRDMARGGEGAPLAPLFHRAIFSRPSKPTAAVNIGGISNLTVLPPEGGGEPVRAYDVGPGVVLMDAWFQHHRGAAFDEDGRWASSGRPVEDVLGRMLDEPYFRKPPPKSTGRELFCEGWLDQFGVEMHDPADIQATLLELTARTIADAGGGAGAPDRMVLCGGGSANTALAGRIAALLEGTQVVKSGELGFPASWVEPAAFAYLAKCRAEAIAVDTSGITGSRPGGHIPGLLARA